MPENGYWKITYFGLKFCSTRLSSLWVGESGGTLLPRIPWEYRLPLSPPPSQGGKGDLLFSRDRELSGVLAKSGPLDFTTKNSFPLFFVCFKTTLFIFQFFIFALLQAKNQFCPQRGFRRWSNGWNLWILRGALRPTKCNLRNFALTLYLRYTDQVHRQNVEKVDKFLSTSGEVKDNLLWSL